MTLDVLVIAPHPDDAELGMGGAILKFRDEGLAVGVLDLTSGEPTPRGSEETRKKETAAATEILGLSWRDNLGLPNRRLEPTLDARAALVIGWSFDKPATFEAVRKFLDKCTGVASDIETVAADRSRFFGPASTPSTPTHQ